MMNVKEALGAPVRLNLKDRKDPMSFGSLVFTPLVKKLQEKYGSRRQYERMENSGATQNRFTPFETEFLAQRDSFYMATTGATGWPYVQHRGGPKGFLKVIDDHTLAFADFRGNKQYISTGNLLTDNRIALIMVDYPRQARLKILGRVEILDGDQAAGWLDRARIPEENTAIERVFVIHVEAYDWNCPQHITPRYAAEEIREGMKSIEDRVQVLEQENEVLRKELAAVRSASRG
jgi:predicted pyridoxine 5'-phosphate oxidase superfamily flavin-nucleotide-binding protein